jgi:hypothetical protein
MAKVAEIGKAPNKSVRLSRTIPKNLQSHKQSAKEFLVKKIPLTAIAQPYEPKKYHYKSTYLGSQRNQYYEDGIIKIPNMNPLQVQRPLKQDQHIDLELAKDYTACNLFKYLNTLPSIFINMWDKSSQKIAEIVTTWVKNHHCYIDLSAQIDPKKPYLRQKHQQLLYPAEYRLQTFPKSSRGFFLEKYDEEGTFICTEVFTTTNLQDAARKKRQLAYKFADKYEPAYQAKEISILFVTLTQINCANQSIQQFIHSVKQRFKKKGIKIHGYVWVLEAGKKTNMLHYHIAIAVDRMQISKLPNWLKFESLWGRRTETTFVKKSIKNYLSKYLKKGSPILEGYRGCGSSKL